MKILKLLTSLSLVLILAACSSQETKEGDAGDATSGTGDGGVVTSPAGALGTINGIRIDQQDSPDSVRTIYFEFDRSEVLPEFLPVLQAHGRLLASDPGKKAVLEGHADERGSREYNIALGERRAMSVRRLLLGYGASDSQIETVSYGEERPAMLGHDETAWSKNRRVEIRYE
jgi:peptidoglycan-associated lipoprotein